MFVRLYGYYPFLQRHVLVTTQKYQRNDSVHLFSALMIIIE